MKIPMFQVDAFTGHVFGGNPAAVCLLEEWLPDEMMLAIAAENNLSETAFVTPQDGAFGLRWFTPQVEIKLCGHATLGAAFVLFDRCEWPDETIRFNTKWSGELSVKRVGDMLEMDFPACATEPCEAPAGLAEALGVQPREVLVAGEDVMVLLEDEAAVRAVDPDFRALSQVDCRGVMVTAPGGDCDFVSRFFAPRVGIDEDPATGSAHCALTPYWADALGEKDLHARQVSARGGELFCTAAGERVTIAGRAALYLEGTITV